MSKIKLASKKGIPNSVKPVKVMISKFESSIRIIIAKFFESDSFKHALSKGVAREKPVRDFFSKNLPKNFSIINGEVVDLFNNNSPQQDCIIYDNNKSVAFVSGDECILPAEAVLCSIEVKSKLTKEEIRKCLESVKKLKSMKPYKNELSPIREKGVPADDKSRYFYSIFAYDTDIKNSDWLKNEYDRLLNVSKVVGINYQLIDRIYVVNKGLILVPNGKGILEEKNNGKALMNFYLHILSFLLRENSRRKFVPYYDYAGSLRGHIKEI